MAYKGNDITFVFCKVPAQSYLPKPDKIKAVLVKDEEMERTVIYRYDGRAFICTQKNFLLFLDGKFEEMTNPFWFNVEIDPFNEVPYYDDDFNYTYSEMDEIAIHSGDEIRILAYWNDFYFDYPLCCMSENIDDFAYVADGYAKERLSNGWVIDQALFLSSILGKHHFEGGTLEVMVDDMQNRLLRVIFNEEHISTAINAVSGFSLEDLHGDYPEVAEYIYRIAEEARVY